MKLFEDKEILLRPLEPEDLDILYQWENDTSLWHLGSTVSPYSFYILKEYISESYKNIYELKQQRLMIVRKDSMQPIGMVDLYDFDPHNSRAGVGVLIDVAHQGKGYGTKAVRLIINYAFSFLKLHQLFAHIPTENKYSLKLFYSLDFIDSGILRDWNSVSGKGFGDVSVLQLINNQLR